MQQQGKKFNPPSVCLGEVISDNPLSIKTEDLILESDDLLVSDILLQGYKRSVDLVSSGTLTSSTQASSGGSGDASFASHNHKISGSYNLEGSASVVFKPYLKAGDLMALMPTANGQTYIVLCKVVSL